MATNANLAIEKVSGSWSIENGTKCFKMVLPDILKRLDITSILFALKQTARKYGDDVTSNIWVLTEQPSTKPSTDPDCNVIFNTRVSGEVHTWDITDAVNALSLDTQTIYIFMELSGVNASADCNFGSSYTTESTISYSDIVRDYSPNMYWDDQDDRIPSNPTTIFSQMLRVTVTNKPPQLSGETYSSSVIFRSYVKGELNGDPIQVTIRTNSTDDLSDGVAATATFSNISFSKGSTYSFTAEYIVSWAEYEFETSGEFQLVNYNVSVIPFTIAPNNMGAAIGRYCETRSNPTEGLFECDWKAKFYNGIVDGDGNPIGESKGVEYTSEEQKIGTYMGSDLYRLTQCVDTFASLVVPDTYDMIVSIYGTVMTNANMVHPVNIYRSSSIGTYVYINNDHFVTSTNLTNIRKVNVTIEYTK